MEAAPRKSQAVTKTVSIGRDSEAKQIAARDELFAALRKAPLIHEALKVPRHANDAAILKALSLVPDVFETLRNAGLSLSEAMHASDLLEMALEAPAEEEVRKKVGRKSLMRVWLSSLCFLELLICGLLVYTLETAAGGWNVGLCSIAMFTNVTCREQTSTRCAVDLEVRGTLDGRLRFYTMQNWYLPVSYKTEMGGSSFASYLGDRLKCCNERTGVAAGSVGGCCSLMEPTTEIFCDNLKLLGMKASDGTDCPGNQWDCLYLRDEFDTARARAVRTYTPPNIINFIIPAGIVGGLMVFSLIVSAIVAGCAKLGINIVARISGGGLEEDAEDVLEDMERDGSSKARSTTSQSSPEPSPRGPPSKGRKSRLSKKDMPVEVFEEVGDASPAGTVTSGSFRDFSKMSISSPIQHSFEEEPAALSPALATVPEAVLSLPGVVQELEAVASFKKGEAQRKAVEEECRKYVKWEAHEKPLHTLGEKDIHPDFRVGNLSRYAMMAEQARSQNAILSPLIEPLPPSMNQPPTLPGSGPSSRPGSRPGTAGRPQSVQAWARPGSARSGGRPTSAQRGVKAKKPAKERMPQKPSSLPAKIEIANF